MLTFMPTFTHVSIPVSVNIYHTQVSAPSMSKSRSAVSELLPKLCTKTAAQHTSARVFFFFLQKCNHMKEPDLIYPDLKLKQGF